MARDKTISAQLDEILGEFAKEERDLLDKSISKASKQCKRDIVAASPDGPNGYKEGWTVQNKKTSHGAEAIVRNKKFPGLTHLLEKSHIIKNQYGTYGRTDPANGKGGKVHIAPAAEKAEQDLMQMLIAGHE